MKHDKASLSGRFSGFGTAGLQERQSVAEMMKLLAQYSQDKNRPGWRRAIGMNQRHNSAPEEMM